MGRAIIKPPNIKIQNKRKSIFMFTTFEITTKNENVLDSHACYIFSSGFSTINTGLNKTKKSSFLLWSL